MANKFRENKTEELEELEELVEQEEPQVAAKPSTPGFGRPTTVLR